MTCFKVHWLCLTQELHMLIAVIQNRPNFSQSSMNWIGFPNKMCWSPNHLFLWIWNCLFEKYCLCRCNQLTDEDTGVDPAWEGREFPRNLQEHGLWEMEQGDTSAWHIYTKEYLGAVRGGKKQGCNTPRDFTGSLTLADPLGGPAFRTLK